MAMFKLGYFVLERIAEPLSRSIEAIARQSPLFRRGCVSLARGFEKRQAERYNRFLKPGEEVHKDELSDEQAIQKGAELLGEGILWMTGISILLHQSYDEERDEEEKENIQDIKRMESERRIHAQLQSSEQRILRKLHQLEERWNGTPKQYTPVIEEENKVETNIKDQVVDTILNGLYEGSETIKQSNRWWSWWSW